MRIGPDPLVVGVYGTPGLTGDAVRQLCKNLAGFGTSHRDRLRRNSQRDT